MWVIFFPPIFLFDSTLDHNSALHAKISEKSLLIESRIEFPDPMLMTLDKGKFNSGLHAKNQRDIFKKQSEKSTLKIHANCCYKIRELFVFVLQCTQRENVHN